MAAGRAWPNIAALLGLVLWWPAGFWGTGDWLRLPLRANEGDILLLGATAAAAVVALLVRRPWPRLLIVVVLSGVGWVLGAPTRDSYPDERLLLVVLLVVGGLLGLLIGRSGHQSPGAAATVLSLVAGLSPATWPHGAVVAVAVALCFAGASWKRVAPTLVSVAGVLLTWLVAALLARSLGYGWAVLHPQVSAGSGVEALRPVGEAAWDFVRTQWWRSTDLLLQGTAWGWFWTALVLALLVVAGRGLLGRGRVTSGVRRR
jgi:hypothetical protein